LVSFWPAGIPAFENQDKKDKTEIVPAKPAQHLHTHRNRLRFMLMCMGYAEGDTDASPLPDAGSEPVIDIEDPTYLMLSGVANLLLLVITTFLGKYWKKARDVLNSINEGLADNTLTKTEIQAIVKAWKG
jgi:hypothetical protein